MKPGLVSLVGAGPGDPELITLRGFRRLQAADVVVYDRLIDPRALEPVNENAERVFAGKAAGQAALDQRAIERVLIDRARAGKRVVRLKGGDPFLFGRGGEEIEALVAAGISCEVVPGVSSALAAPASAGIPVTHRHLSSCLTVITGHEDPSKPESSIDWSWLGKGSGTLVVLMGLERLPAICARLMEEGRSPTTPSAVISAGTWVQQRAVFGPLADLADLAAGAGLQSPALSVIGEVTRFPAHLASLASELLAEAV